jgi:hypothetical protein
MRWAMHRAVDRCNLREAPVEPTPPIIKLSQEREVGGARIHLLAIRYLRKKRRKARTVTETGRHRPCYDPEEGADAEPDDRGGCGPAAGCRHHGPPLPKVPTSSGCSVRITRSGE